MDATTNHLTSYSTTVAYTGFGLFLIGFLILVLVYLKVKERYIAWITDKLYKNRWGNLDKKVKVMNYLQLGTVALCIFAFYIIKSFLINATHCIPISPSVEEDQIFNQEIYAIFAGIVITAVLFVIFFIMCKNNRKQVVMFGIRNMLTLVCGVIITLRVYEGGIISSNSYGVTVEKTVKQISCGFDIAGVFIVLVIFEIIYILIHRRQKRRLSDASQ